MPTRRPYHHGNLREAVLAAARTMVASQGAAQLSLRAVARVVGVSHPALYSHFRSRQDLMLELSKEALQALADHLQRAAARGKRPVDALLALAAAYFRFGLADPARLQLAFAAELAQSTDRDLRAAATAAEAPVIAAMTRAAAERWLPAADVRARSVALWSLVHGFTLLAIDGRLSAGRLSVDPAGRRSMLRVLLAGVRQLLGAGRLRPGAGARATRPQPGSAPKRATRRARRPPPQGVPTRAAVPSAGAASPRPR